MRSWLIACANDWYKYETSWTPKSLFHKSQQASRFWLVWPPSALSRDVRDITWRDRDFCHVSRTWHHVTITWEFCKWKLSSLLFSSESHTQCYTVYVHTHIYIWTYVYAHIHTHTRSCTAFLPSCLLVAFWLFGVIILYHLELCTMFLPCIISIRIFIHRCEIL